MEPSSYMKQVFIKLAFSKQVCTVDVKKNVPLSTGFLNSFAVPSKASGNR